MPLRGRVQAQSIRKQTMYEKAVCVCAVNVYGKAVIIFFSFQKNLRFVNYQMISKPMKETLLNSSARPLVILNQQSHGKSKMVAYPMEGKDKLEFKMAV